MSFFPDSVLTSIVEVELNLFSLGFAVEVLSCLSSPVLNGVDFAGNESSVTLPLNLVEEVSLVSSFIVGAISKAGVEAGDFETVDVVVVLNDVVEVNVGAVVDFVVVVVVVVVFNDVVEVNIGAVADIVDVLLVVVDAVVTVGTFDVCLVVEITDLVVLDVLIVAGFTDDEKNVSFVFVSLAMKEDEF